MTSAESESEQPSAHAEQIGGEQKPLCDACEELTCVDDDFRWQGEEAKA